jgi:hypothetical protein
MPWRFEPIENRALGYVYLPVNVAGGKLGLDDASLKTLEPPNFLAEAIWFEKDPSCFDDVWVDGYQLELYHIEIPFEIDDYLSRLHRVWEHPHQSAVRKLGYDGQNGYAKHIAPCKAVYEAIAKRNRSLKPFSYYVPRFDDLGAFADKMQKEMERLSQAAKVDREQQDALRRDQRESLLAALEAIRPYATKQRYASEAFLNRLIALLEALRAGKMNEALRVEARRLAAIWNRDESRPQLALPNHKPPKMRGRPPLPASAKIRKPPGEPKLKPHIQARA